MLPVPKPLNDQGVWRQG